MLDIRRAGKEASPLVETPSRRTTVALPLPAPQVINTTVSLAEIDRVMARARACWAAEREAREARREQLILRGEARAIRGRLYDMIQTGGRPAK
jgi:hypothetical protein